MNARKSLVFILLAACAALTAGAGWSADSQSGNWTVNRSDEAGKVEFSLMQTRLHGHSNYSSDWPATAFAGVDFSKPGRQDVKFTIARDAGRFECEGFLDNGEGAGVFHFFADAQYVQKMKGLGFDGIDDEKQISMAIEDVSLKFAQDMKNEHLEGLDTDKLIAFRIFRVTPEFIEQLRSSGLRRHRQRQAGCVSHPRRFI